MEPTLTRSALALALAHAALAGCGSSHSVDGDAQLASTSAVDAGIADGAVDDVPPLSPLLGSPTHGPDAEPNYDEVFDPDRVHTIHISMPADTFNRMQENLEELIPSGPGGGPGAGTASLPEAWTRGCQGLGVGDVCDVDGMGGTCIDVPIGDAGVLCVPDSIIESRGAGGEGDGPARGALDLIGEDPMYVEVEITREGKTWSHVGMRYKGNSSLASSARTGVEKLPFRLDFDEYEDDFPETLDQRFHGFKKLTFSSNFSDQSLLRDTLYNEILRERGLPAPHTAFYRVFVDTGDGDVYWGLYTAIEDPSDGAMLEREFGSSDGNLYKPESTWATFVEAEFPKKTNEGPADFSDVEAAVAALHDDASDAETWRANLEAVFDVDAFLGWLALNTVVVDWDSYGRMPHNYYVYGDPNDGGRLVWIAWDHNMSMTTRSGFGGGDFDDIFHEGVDERWPLISRLLADDTYAMRYREAVEASLTGAFALDTIEARMRELHAMIEPFVVGQGGERAPHSNLADEAAFLDSIDGEGGLMEHVRSRHMVVEAALSAR